MSESSPFRIVVAGGGAGGLELVTSLGRRYRKHEDVEIYLVDTNHAHIWKPLLHEVAAGTLNSNDDEMSYLAHAHWNHFNFRLGPITGCDRKRQVLFIGASADDSGHQYIPARELSYDILVIAIGSITNDFDIEGVSTHCDFLDGREQADAFHRRMVRNIYSANAQSTPLRDGQLHVAIAGAGATGVELAAELHHSMEALVGYGLTGIDPKTDIRIHLIEGSDRILPGLSARISTATEKMLIDMNIEIHTGEFVAHADEHAFVTKSGKTIPAEMKIWAAGIKGPKVMSNLDGLELNRANQIVVKSTLQSVVDERIFAIGDCAQCTVSPDSDQIVPPRAQAAHQQAATVSKAIHNLQKDRELPVFRYRDFGSLINLSSHSTIGSLMGNLFGRQSGSVPIEGLFARVAYLSLYKMHQIAVQGLIRTGFMSVANFLTRRSKPRLKLH